ncbi:type II toxin-antitoxin system PemK/MazF family toxin [Clostridium sp. CF012]|uniref:type II toxin-antitoxin system PemK/MazF family toxin n=1 Tax=Clostridium sp. CF012 TaxID=2843319 RepID=UPI001C0D52C6|nr:type II toxin-antitoxin system PemK/MazF family toxin [Clostridium sp. CF012]MBU3143349.1 type II toxin-antitoxin system PemK/MazF family toxin [Clostridium sp. CF012]
MSTGFFRNDIWTCNIKESYKNVIAGKHPVIIISNFKHILKSDTINVLGLTSNLNRNSKSHVKIDGYGLDMESRVLCEQIITVNKSDLLNKVGHVDNVKMFEINNCLKQHLQLDSRYKNLESEDLEELFFMGAGKMDLQRELNILKSEIKTAYLKEDNYKCMELLDELIEKSKTNSFLWFGYYSKSLIYMRYNDMENALINAKESLRYVNEVDIMQQDYSLSMFSVARCYQETDIKKAVGIYKTLSQVYRELTNDKLRIGVLYNIARLQHNLKAMERLIGIVEKTNANDWYFDITKDAYLKGLKGELDAVKGI